VVDGMMGGLRFADVFLNAFLSDQEQRRPLLGLVNSTLPNAASNTWVKQSLNYPRARRVLQYISECALPPGERVRFWSADGTWQGWFDGVAGVAPEWTTGWCNERCQQTVSACLYSRVNGDDRVVPINLRRNVASGGHLVDNFWRQNYKTMESATWGNFFRGTDQYGFLDMHVCFGFDAPAGDWRVARFKKRYCGENDTSQACASVITGPCGLTRSCPLAANDPFKKQCKGNPWDANGAAGACSPVPWENVCTSGHANPESYPTMTVYRADRCAHPDFQEGAALERECSPCVQAVAKGEHGLHCTTEQWDATCVADARTLCAQGVVDPGLPVPTEDPTAGAQSFPLRLGTADLVDAVCKDSSLQGCCQVGGAWVGACATRAAWCAQPANAGSATCTPPPQP